MQKEGIREQAPPEMNVQSISIAASSVNQSHSMPSGEEGIAALTSPFQRTDSSSIPKPKQDRLVMKERLTEDLPMMIQSRTLIDIN